MLHFNELNFQYISELYRTTCSHFSRKPCAFVNILVIVWLRNGNVNV